MHKEKNNFIILMYYDVYGLHGKVMNMMIWKVNKLRIKLTIVNLMFKYCIRIYSHIEFSLPWSWIIGRLGR